MRPFTTERPEFFRSPMREREVVTQRRRRPQTTAKRAPGISLHAFLSHRRDGEVDRRPSAAPASRKSEGNSDPLQVYFSVIESTFHIIVIEESMSFLNPPLLTGSAEGSVPWRSESYDDGPCSISISGKNKRGLVAASTNQPPTERASCSFAGFPRSLPRHEIEEISVAAVKAGNGADSLSDCGRREGLDAEFATFH